MILDGFDEVPEERRNAVEKWVTDLAVVAKNTALLVTSRPLQSGHLEGLKNPWQQWDLLPFDEPRIVEFIERWHRFLPEGELSATERKVDAKALARTFFNDPSLKPLADTPLMLGTLLFVHHRDKKLPSGRVDLYERYIAAMLGLRDSGLGIQARATKLSDKEKRRVLAHIALHFHLHRVNEASDEIMRQLVTEALTKFRFEEDVDRLLAALRERTGLLQGPGAWSFMHKTIGEFLVAELVCDGTTRLSDKRRLDRKELWAHRHEDTWTAVLFFWAGKTSPRELEEFIGELMDEGKGEAIHLALSLLHDQGDRLTHETQRGLAVRLTSKPQLSVKEHSSSVVYETHTGPSFVFSTYSVNTVRLPGLSTVDYVVALRTLFEHRVLTSADLQTCHPTARAALTMAALWALHEVGSTVTLEVRHYFEDVPPRDLALFCFGSIYYRTLHNETLGWQSLLGQWLEAFPEGRAWVPLLLIGLASESRHHSDKGGALKRVGPEFWAWRDQPLAEDWVRESNDCRGFHSERRSDLIEETSQSLKKDGAVAWGVSAEQHADLLVWCDRIMAWRAELKAAVKK